MTLLLRELCLGAPWLITHEHKPSYINNARNVVMMYEPSEMGWTVLKIKLRLKVNVINV